MDGHSFSERVWLLATSIPPGRVSTYGDIAKAAGSGPLAARSISSILSKAPNPKAIPWHRIVYSNGKVWLSNEHEKKRRLLYQREGIKLDRYNRIIDFAEKRFNFLDF